MYFFRFCFVLFQLGLRTLFLRSGSEKRAYKALADLEVELNGTFRKETLKKIVKYHSLHKLLNFHIFNKLQGRLTSKEESRRLFNYSILHVLFDNFFDEKTHDLDQIRAMTFQPHSYKAEIFEERVFLKAGLFLLNEIRDKNAYLEVCRRIVDIQSISLEQFNLEIELERLKYITFEKGGCAISLCRFYLDTEISETEKNCWFILGEIVQLSTDIYDIYFDLQDGIQTIPIKLGNALALEEIYRQKVDEMKMQIANLPYSSSSKKNFNILMMSIVSFGFVGIAQLNDLQKNTHSVVEFKLFNRKDLIVDMEKLKTMWRWLKYTFILGKI